MADRNGLQRVVMVYRPENFQSALEEFRNVLGITDFDGPHDLHALGLRIVLSWDTGIEIITPMAQGAYVEAMWEVLNTKGEGVFNLVYQVDDLSRAEQRAALHGRPRVGGHIDALAVQDAWRERFRMALEAPLPPIAGVPVTLIQLETRN